MKKLFFILITSLLAACGGGENISLNTSPLPSVLSPVITAVAPATGPIIGGTTLTITGVNLTGATVSFDGVASPNVTVNADTQLTVVTPPHVAGNVAIVVKTLSGTTVSTDRYSYIYSGVVVTLAGSTTKGAVDGSGVGVKFYYPVGIAIDSNGNKFVGDSYNNEIRKITPDGVVTTFAGATTSGAIDGAGTSARFNKPTGMAFDSNGNLFVSDQANQMIRKISPAGVVTTFAGSTTFGAVDGVGTAAKFSWPTGIVIDKNNNLYVSDQYNNMIRKITPDGVVTTLAGSTSSGAVDGIGVAAKFNKPAGITMDSNGNLFVADSSNQLIRKITPAGVVSTVAGAIGVSGFNNGTGATARFYFPIGMAIDASNNLYVGDSYNNMIRKITSEGVVTTVAGTSTFGSTNGPVLTAGFSMPMGLALDSSGVIYVADTYNNMIRMIY